jgi:hypothetical protein
MRVVYVGFSNPFHKVKYPWFAWLIQYSESFDRWINTGRWGLQNYTHTYICWHSRAAESMIYYEASATGVNFKAEKLWDQKATRVLEYSFNLSEEQYRKLLKFCMNLAGTQYGAKQVLGLIYVKVAALIGYRVKNPWEDGIHSFPCTELVMRFMAEVLGADLSDIHPEYATVSDVREFVGAYYATNR